MVSGAIVLFFFVNDPDCKIQKSLDTPKCYYGSKICPGAPGVGADISSVCKGHSTYGRQIKP